MMKKRIFALCALAALSLSLLAGCGPKEPGDQQEKKVDLAAFAQSVQENHEFPAMEKADPADADVGVIMLGNYYPGLTDMELEQMEIYLAVISFTGGELSLAQAKNADDAAKVKAIFQARIDAKTTDGIGNYPEELETWQRSSRLVENGNYLMLVCNEDCDAIVDEFNALFK